MSDEERIVRYTPEELEEKQRRGESQTDWARVDAMREEELEASIDFEEEGEIDWDKVDWDRILANMDARQQHTIRVDEDVLAWFREQGPDYQTRMNQVLRAHVEAQRDKDKKAS